MGQGIELFFPEDAVMLDPLRRGFHGLGGQAAAVDAAVDFAREQAGGFEDAEVLGDGGKGKGKGSGEFGDGGLALRKAGEDGAAGGVGEGGKGGVEGSGGRCGIVNHTVYYCPELAECQGNSEEKRIHHRGHREHREDRGEKRLVLS